MDTETEIKRTYLVHTHDGWHEFRASFAEAELEARAYALSSYQHGGNGRAYLFTVPNGAGNQPAEVEFTPYHFCSCVNQHTEVKATADRKPINLPLGVASCCRLYVADPYRGGNATGSLGLVNPDIVRHHFAEIFAPSAQYPAPAPMTATLYCCPPLHRAIMRAIERGHYSVTLFTDGTYRAEGFAHDGIAAVERVWSKLPQEAERELAEAGSAEEYAAREACRILCRYGESALDCYARNCADREPESCEETRNRVFTPYFRPLTPHA